MADMAGQVEFDMGMFPQHAPDPKAEAAAKKKKEAERKKKKTPLSKGQIEAADKLAQKAKHEKEAEEKRATVRRVQQYIKHFGDKIETKLPRNFGTKMSLEDLKEIERNVELDLHSQGGTEYACSLYEHGIGFLQDMSNYYNPLGLALSGPVADLKGTVAAQRSGWVPIMEELAIKYERWFAVGPERRLLFFTASLLTLVHRANSVPQQMEQRAQETAPDLEAELGGI